MSGGPIFPNSAYPANSSGLLFPNFYAGGGGNVAPHDEGLGFAASLSSNAYWELRFACPPTVPTGTLKLRLLFLANATSGIALLAVKDAAVPPANSPSAATLTNESPWSAINVSGVTNTTNPTITTSTNHSLAVGNVVTITSVGGATGVNGTFTVQSVPSSTTFTITLGTAPGAYTTGGTVTQQIGAGWTSTSGYTADDYLELKVPLSATPAGNNMLVVALEGLTSGWTLATTLTVIASILWE